MSLLLNILGFGAGPIVAVILHIVGKRDRATQAETTRTALEAVMRAEVSAIRKEVEHISSTYVPASEHERREEERAKLRAVEKELLDAKLTNLQAQIDGLRSDTRRILDAVTK